jgi:thiamine pyrophosphate-dependent acetolactate synthase large subunit-like protein
MLERRKAIATLMANRGKDLFVVPGLGSCTYDMASLGEKDSDFYLWGAMGGAAMIGLGLALAKPKLKVAVITGDGEMLMGMGSLATIGVQRPNNLAVIVFDNRRYGETGMQASHTDRGVDLVGVAKSCGIARAFDVEDEAGLKTLAGELAALSETLFARVHIKADDPPRVLPTKDGVELKLRFRKAVAAAG